MTPVSRVTRFEVVDWTGRAYTAHNVEVTLDYQDDGRTLKVFIKEARGESPARVRR